MTKSYAGEVIVYNTGKWCGNAMRFATENEAAKYVSDLHSRWAAVREKRVVESDDPVNYRWENGHAVAVETKDLQIGAGSA